jgi:3-methylfumaryl-CoA hydratase
MTDDFKAWIGRTEALDDPMSVTQARAVQAMLDDTGAERDAGDTVPLPWHWFYFLPRAPQSALDDDGHPRRGGFLPPIPYPRRMFAGARMTMHRPLRLGQVARREAVIRDVVLKSGKSGSLAFVTVGLRFVQDGQLCVEEEQDIVYREPGGRVPAPVAAPWPALPEGSVERTWHPDSRLLFRFSALTFNAHRIHYDRGYASEVEGYPGLVVHGPMTAVMLLRLAHEATGRVPMTFAFRGLSPLFDLGPVRLVATPGADHVELQAQGPDGKAGMSATAGFGATAPRGGAAA